MLASLSDKQGDGLSSNLSANFISPDGLTGRCQAVGMS
jgi:hypothetical protein